MKRAHVVASLLVGALLYSGSALAQTPQVISVPISNPGEPITLEISILSAKIHVYGEDRDDVEFEVSVSDGRRQIITPSGPKPLAGAGYELEIDEEDNYISLDTDWRANNVTVTARVPRNANLILETVNDGEVLAQNVAGNLQLENTNGPVTARNIRGSIIAESVNDVIDVSFDALSSDAPTSMTTINGDLRIAIPEDAGVQLHLDTGMGEIYSDFEVDVQPSQPVIEREEDNDGIEVRIESVIVANINGGGPIVRLKTLHGDINIAKRDD